MGLFVLLIVGAGSFPLHVSPGLKADVTTAVLFCGALLLEPGVAALAGVVGIVSYNLLNGHWGERLRLPWYKYPFNAGQTALFVGATSVVFGALTTGEGVLTPVVVPAAAVMYLANTILVSGAVGLQVGVNPLRVWWSGTMENGPAELGQLAFGFLGAVAYRESPWTIVALFIPVAVIYLAFSRLARANVELKRTLQEMESLQGRIVSTSKLASVGAISLDLAHQIKNPLAVVLGRLEVLQDYVEERSRARLDLDQATEAGWRIQELAQTFSSIGQQRWVELDIPELMDEAVGIAKLRHRTRAETRRDFPDTLPKGSGNPVLIREAFSNIFSNALEAIDQGGVVEIGAVQVNGTIVLRVSDNGIGISRAEMERLFEPFHSTKSNGHGLGALCGQAYP